MKFIKKATPKNEAAFALENQLFFHQVTSTLSRSIILRKLINA